MTETDIERVQRLDREREVEIEKMRKAGNAEARRREAAEPLGAALRHTPTGDPRFGGGK